MIVEVNSRELERTTRLLIIGTSTKIREENPPPRRQVYWAGCRVSSAAHFAQRRIRGLGRSAGPREAIEARGLDELDRQAGGDPRPYRPSSLATTT